MEHHTIEPPALSVMRLQARGMALGQTRPLGRRRAPADPPERGQAGAGPQAAFARDRRLQGRVRRPQVDVLERRRLVRDLVSGEGGGRPAQAEWQGAKLRQGRVSIERGRRS